MRISGILQESKKIWLHEANMWRQKLGDLVEGRQENQKEP